MYIAIVLTKGRDRDIKLSFSSFSLSVAMTSLLVSLFTSFDLLSLALASIAILSGLVGIFWAAKSLALVAVAIGGVIAIVTLARIDATKPMDRPINADIFDDIEGAVDLERAPLRTTSLEELRAEFQYNKIAARQRYSRTRLQFLEESVAAIEGSEANPQVVFSGENKGTITHFKRADFSKDDSATLFSKKQGDLISFRCTKIIERFGGGRSLTGCKLR